MAKSNYEIRIRITPEGFEVIDGATGDLKRMEAAAGGVDNKFARMNQTIGGIASGVERLGKRMMLLGTAGVVGLGAVAVAGMKYNSQVEEMTAKLSNFLKTQREIREAFSWAQEAVLGTPLMTKEMVNTITILETYGNSYQKWGKVVADTAAAVKNPGESLTDTMDRIAEALGRMKVGETGEANKTFRSMGINVHDAGLKFDDANHLIDDTEVALEKLNKYMTVKFGGGMERLGKTWGGLWLAMKGQVIRNLGEALAPTFKLLKARFADVMAFIRSPAGKEAMQKWGKVLQEMFTEAIRMADSFRRHVFPIFMRAAKWFSELSARGRVWTILFPIIAGAVMVLVAKVALMIIQLRVYAATLAQATIARNALTAAEARGAAAATTSTAATGAAGKAAAGAAVGFNTWALAIAAAVAQIAGLAALSEWLIPKLSGGRGAGPIKDAKMAGSLIKDMWRGTSWEEVSEKYKNAKTYDEWQGKFVQAPLTHTPRAKPLGSTPWGATGFPAWEAEGGAFAASGAGGGDGGGGDGGGGGGGGGIGTRGRGGTTIYQSFERDSIQINTAKVDEKSFLKLMGKIVETESPA